MNDETAVSRGKASPVLRDRFVTALDADDYATLHSLSNDLRRCTDVLPSAVCVTLGLPRGSTYATAAKAIVTS
jgi:hypothetical protein